jgi:hypothetical protein
MTEQNAASTNTVDLNIDELFDMEGMIRAAEADDDLACVLRFHLLLEKSLNFYVDRHRVGELKTYIKNSWQYSLKLGVAVAFGLPPALAATYYQLNKMRNDFAHGSQVALDPKGVEQLARCVNRLGEIDASFKPVATQYVSVHKFHQGRPVAFGTAGPRMDFVLCAMVFLRFSSK